MNNSNKNLYNTIMIIFITVIVTLLLSTAFIYNWVKSSPGTQLAFDVEKSKADANRALASIRGILDMYYLGDIPDDYTMIEGAVKGYVDALDDEYTEYLTASDWNEFKEEQLGNYVGLGVYLKSVENGQQIVNIIKGSPAEKAELMVDDIMVKVDEIVCTKDNGSEVTNYIKTQPEGTVFNIDIIRDGQTITKEVKTEKIRAIQVESKMIEDNIGYLKLSTFDMECANDFKEKCRELVKNGAKGIIIDLRNNTGGVMNEAISICDMFLDKDQTIVITRDKKENRIVYKSNQNKEIDLPMVVLINSYSASASEIMAGALKDNKRATLIGTTTFGKGVIQDVLSLTNGSSLKLTTHEFITPNGDKIHKVGVSPDIELDIPDKYSNIIFVPEGEDNQLQKAIEILKSID